MAISPTEPWAFEDTGTIRLDQNDVDRAIPLFQKALALNPKLTPSLAGLGRAYLRKGKTDLAISYLGRAVALQSDSANYHYQLGQAYLKKGLRAEAEKQFAEQHKLQAAEVEKQGDKIFGRLPPPAEPKQ